MTSSQILAVALIVSCIALIRTEVAQLNVENFESTIKESDSVLVAFVAPWWYVSDAAFMLFTLYCSGYCRELAPTLYDISSSQRFLLTFVQLATN